MLYIILIGIASFFVAVLAIQNSMPVELSFFTMKFNSNLIVVIILSLLAGIFIAFCWGLKLKTQHYIRERKAQDRINKLEYENKGLKKRVADLNYEEPIPEWRAPQEKGNGSMPPKIK